MVGKRLLAWCLIALLVLPALVQSQDAPAATKAVRLLDEARRLAKAHTPYGTDRDQLVCTTFVVAVLKSVLGDRITQEVESAINIRSIADNDAARKAAVEGDVAAIRGVRKALVDAGLGEEVALSELAAGDLVQYWYLNDAEAWEGHVGVVDSVTNANQRGADIELLGAHRSLGTTGTLTVKLRLGTKRNTKVFAVRLKP